MRGGHGGFAAGDWERFKRVMRRHIAKKSTILHRRCAGWWEVIFPMKNRPLDISLPPLTLL